MESKLLDEEEGEEEEEVVVDVLRWRGWGGSRGGVASRADVVKERPMTGVGAAARKAQIVGNRTGMVDCVGRGIVMPASNGFW